MIKHIIAISALVASSSAFAGGELDHCYAKPSKDACNVCIDDELEEFYVNIRTQEGFYDAREAYDLALENEKENKNTENEQATDAAKRKLDAIKERIYNRIHDLHSPDVVRMHAIFGEPFKPSTDARNKCDQIVPPKRERPRSPTGSQTPTLRKKPTVETKKPL